MSEQFFSSLCGTKVLYSRNVYHFSPNLLDLHIFFNVKNHVLTTVPLPVGFYLKHYIVHLTSQICWKQL